MDVQGSQFHLLHGQDDWARCTDPASGQLLTDLWEDALHDLPSGPRTDWQYDEDLDVMRLHRQTPLFRRAGRSAPLDLAGRRGAGRDAYGTWYWVDADQRSIRWLPEGESAASTWWSVDDLVVVCQDAPPAAVFVRAESAPPVVLVLQGLAVTRHHRLIVGYLSPDEQGGLLVFDLHGGGAPLRMAWPSPVPFVPWDLADTADGGVLVLDADHGCYWRLDADLQVLGRRPTHPALFQPADPPPARSASGPSCPPVVVDDSLQVLAFPLLGPDGVTSLPAQSIEPGPAGTVLVLGTRSADGWSTLSCFDEDRLLWSRPLVDVVEVVDPRDPTSTASLFSLTGYDFCFLEPPDATGPLQAPALYIADAEGDQVVAFTLDPATGDLLPRPDFLPLRRWGGRALVRAAEGAWYDYGERWVPLAVFTECRFALTATLTTRVPSPPVTGTSGEPAGLAGEPFDSQQPGCVWHRLFLDAQVPTGTSISVRARAADEATLVQAQQWLPQPVPYQRSDGGELAWYDPWADRRDSAGALPDGTGTFELLLQHVVGRYLQVEVSVRGGGRSSPLLRSLRAWYPRFSYPQHYLPEVYVENDAPERFLERFLAVFEGMFTTWEEHIEHSHLLLDARTVPEGDLRWLAAFFGLALDGQWSERQRRFLVRHVDRFYRTRGTLAGLVASLRVLLDPGVDEDAFCCGTGGSVAAGGGAGVRVVERFLTRGYDLDTWRPGDPPPPERVRAAAHRFDVFVPRELSAGETAMVERIVTAARPSHTQFSLQPYDEVFLVGRARLGIDTVLGRAPTMQPLRLGEVALDRGWLAYSHPLDIPDRVVVDRDRLGALPPL